jgi:hypothetical protein
MSRSGRFGWYAAAGACFGTAILLSQVRFKTEREFPQRFGDLAGEEHGHERAADAADEFFGVREFANRLQWLLYALGIVFAVRGILRSGSGGDEDLSL